jgi:predicted nucleic acid-binding protein
MLLDTSGLFALLHRSEPEHQAAKKAYHTAHVRVTHSYVLAELIPLSHVRGLPRQGVLDFSQRVLADPGIEVAWVDAPLHQEALRLLLARPDKNYSLCDAVSFVLMRHRG